MLKFNRSLFTLLIFSLLILLINKTNAQNNVGIGTATPNSSSILELQSNSKGFLPPRMSTTERNGITNPVEGMTLFNTTTKCNEWYSNGVWVNPCSQLLALSGKSTVNKLLGGSNTELGGIAQETTDGGYIVAGYTASSASGDVTGTNHSSNGFRDCWIVKLDIYGNIVWNKLFGSNGDESINDIQQTTDGGYIFVGEATAANGDIIGPGHNSNDMLVVKLDAAGNVSWQHLFGGNDADVGNSVQQTTDGGYIIAGASLSTATGDVTDVSRGSYDYWVVKLDATGNISWNKLLGGTGLDQAFSIRQTDDGGYIVTGQSNSPVSGDVLTVSRGGYDIWTVKLNSVGAITWSKMMGGTGDDVPYSAIQTAEGGYIITGISNSSNSFDVTNTSHGSGDSWIIKLSANGGITWNKLLGGTGTDYTVGIVQTSDGGYVMAGSSFSSASGDISGTTHGSSDLWLVKIDGTGTILWNRLIGGTGGEYPLSLRQTVDGGFIIGANTISSSSGDVINANHGSNDIWLLKVNALGRIIK